MTALVTGKLIADPERRTGGSGKTFTLAKVAAHTEDGDSLVSAIAFGHLADQLAELGKGDAVALTGRAKPQAWTGREGELRAGLSLTVDGMLTAYHLRRRRQAMAPAESEGGAAA